MNVKREILPNRQNFSKDIPSINGSIFTGYKYGTKSINVEVAIFSQDKTDYVKKVRNLARILNTKNPCRFEVSDEPDKYYYAIVDGSTELEKKFSTGKAEITFLCNDPVAYSDVIKTFVPDANNIFSIENNGTMETAALLDIDFNNAACFFQATNPYGQTVLVGSPLDVTKETIPANNKIVDDKCESSTNFLGLAGTLLDNQREITGQQGVGMYGSAMICTNYGTGKDKTWTGCGFKRVLPQPVQGFEVRVDLVFSSQGENYGVSKPSGGGSSGGGNTGNLGVYEVVNCGGLWINENPNTSKPIFAMPPGTKVYPVEIKGNWVKHTHKNKGKTYTGWSSLSYLKKISKSSSRTTGEMFTGEEAKKYAEDELGILEVYGFDKNGAKLFKIQFTDSNPFYEYVEPQVYFGNTLVLDDAKYLPAPRVVKVKDDNSQKEIEKQVASGVFGDFNDFEGNVIIRREKHPTGSYVWTASITKVKDGCIEKSIATSNCLCNTVDFPDGELNYLGFFIGRFGDSRPVDAIGIKNIEVKNLVDVKIDNKKNLSIFEKGDHLQIDFSSGMVTLNEKPFLTHLDIGSEFFDLPTGRSQFVIKTDDPDAKVVCGVQEKYI